MPLRTGTPLIRRALGADPNWDVIVACRLKQALHEQKEASAHLEEAVHQRERYAVALALVRPTVSHLTETCLSGAEMAHRAQDTVDTLEDLASPGKPRAPKSGSAASHAPLSNVVHASAASAATLSPVGGISPQELIGVIGALRRRVEELEKKQADAEREKAKSAVVRPAFLIEYRVPAASLRCMCVRVRVP